MNIQIAVETRFCKTPSLDLLDSTARQVRDEIALCSVICEEKRSKSNFNSHGRNATPLPVIRFRDWRCIYTKIIAFCLHSLQGTSSPFRFYSFGSYCPINRNADNILLFLRDVIYLIDNYDLNLDKQNLPK